EQVGHSALISQAAGAAGRRRVRRVVGGGGGSGGGGPGVGGEDRTGDEAAGGGREVQRGAGELLRLPRAAHRGHQVPLVDLRAAGLVEAAGQLGAHVPGRDRVDAHAPLGPLERGAAGEVVHRRLGGVVGGLGLGDVGDDPA